MVRVCASGGAFCVLVILVWGIVACWSYLFGVLRPTGTLWQAGQGEVQVT